MSHLKELSIHQIQGMMQDVLDGAGLFFIMWALMQAGMRCASCVVVRFF